MRSTPEAPRRRTTSDRSRLKGCLSDLVALSTMSAWWIDRTPEEIAGSLRELLKSVLRLEPHSLELRTRLDLDDDLVERGWRRITVPIGLDGELGRIVVASPRADFPDELELVTMKVAANQVAVALRHAALLQRHASAVEHQQTRAAQQAAVARLGLRALDGLVLDETLDETVSALCRTSNADAGTIMEAMEGGSWLRPRVAVGWHNRPAVSTRVSASPTEECGYALASSEPTMFTDLRRETRFGATPLLESEGFLSGMSIVVRTRTGPFGVLAIHSRQPREFTDDDVHFQQAMANLIGVAVDHARGDAERRLLMATMAEARAAAERASRVKSEFLGMMSHELRTPLNAVGGYAQLLQDHVYGPVNEEQRAALERIRRAQQYLLSLINSVLSSLKLSSGRMHFEITDVAVAEALLAVEEMIRPQMVAKGIDFRSTLPGAAVRVRAEEEKLCQIMLNLLSNATKFTAPGGQIHVECDVTEHSVGVHVVDTGHGIPPERLAMVFEPFVQVEGSASRGEGTGLGLAISRDLAMGMGGRLDVRSAVGQGSTFTLTLPRSA
jgi:signal transduction histidine kinase